MKQKFITVDAAWLCPWNNPETLKDGYYCTHPDGPTNCLERKFPAGCPLRTHEYIIKLAAAAIVEEK